MLKKGVQGCMLLGMLLGLPLLGVVLTGQDIRGYLHFPPQTEVVTHAPFSWPVFAFLLLVVCVVVIPLWVWCIIGVQPKFVLQRTQRRFPWWGWLGLGITGVDWILAWTRFSWFAWGQLYTFPVLWLGYVLAVNAWTCRRSGRCMLMDRPKEFLLLFPASAVFWWFFEYLNRFVQNWHYMHVQQFSGLEYVVHASVCFTTVLPAVLGTRDLLSTFPVFEQCFSDMLPIRPQSPKTLAVGVCLISGAGLAGIGLWPGKLFPLLWISPLLILVSGQVLFGEDHMFRPAWNGNWTPLVTAALAALICGFFWEMWNYYSLAKWVYSVPYVQRFHLFEMPILGYAGYLPFGLECAAIEIWLFGRPRK